MDATLQVGLTSEQRDTLLKALRYLRSSISMELINPNDEASRTRQERLQQVQSLEAQLASAEQVQRV
jgi:hypothetical protein